MTVPQGKGEWILIVEDDPELSVLLEFLLIESGFNIVKTTNGIEAEYIYTNHTPKIDLIISDMGLPSQGGLELFEKLIAKDKNLRFIAMSGLGDKDMINKLKLHGIKIFLPKPFHADTLINTVRNLLDGNL